MSVLPDETLVTFCPGQQSTNWPIPQCLSSSWIVNNKSRQEAPLWFSRFGCFSQNQILKLPNNLVTTFEYPYNAESNKIKLYYRGKHDSKMTEIMCHMF